MTEKIDEIVEGSFEVLEESQAEVPAKLPRMKKVNGRHKPTSRYNSRISDTVKSNCLNYYLSGLSIRDTAKLLNISAASAGRIIKKHRPLIDKINGTRGHTAKIRRKLLNAAEVETLKSVMDPKKHREASLRDAAQAFGVLHKANRLERGESTANLSSKSEVKFTEVNLEGLPEPE